MREIGYRYANEWNNTRHTEEFVLKNLSSPKHKNLLKLLEENASMEERNHAEYSLWTAFLIYSNLRAAVSKIRTYTLVEIEIRKQRIYRDIL